MIESARDLPELEGLDLDAWAAAIAARLGPWFQHHQRDLEWRRTRDPYAIWVSEIMLQQTRVETVKDFYSRFLARFPDVGTLAAADQEDVLEAWSGLGYYRRARLLHKGARYVLDAHDGRVPARADELRAVPGVGPYTAGAIASIAFDKPVALVDGNVARVLSRLLAIETPERQGASARAHWVVTQAVLERGSPRVLAQGLMELGATVCTPQSPRCAACPLRQRCRAHARGLSSQIPAVRRKIAQPVDELWAAAIYWRGHLLLERRPATGLLAGMWCLPLLPRASTDSQADKTANKTANKTTNKTTDKTTDKIPNQKANKTANKKRANKLAKLAKERAKEQMTALAKDRRKRPANKPARTAGDAATETRVAARKLSPARVKEALGLRVRGSEPLPTIVKHVFTHRVWNMRPCRLEALARARATLDEQRFVWIARGQRPAGGLPKVTQKLLASLDH